MSNPLTPQDALVAVMIAASAADAKMSDSEIASINRIVDVLPIFEDYDRARLGDVIHLVFQLFDEEDGLDRLIRMVNEVLPEGLTETAYAFACDVVAADGRAEMEELRLLEMLRYDLHLDRLTTAAIERAARARHRRLE